MTDTAEEMLASIGVWWPDGDEEGLRAAAAQWRIYAEAVDSIAAGADAQARRVGEQTGPSIAAFGEFWQRYSGPDTAYLPTLARGARSLASALEQYADRVAEARRRVMELAATAGATVVAGTVLAFFTFGLTELISASAAAALVSAADAIGVSLSAEVTFLVADTIGSAGFEGIVSMATDVAVVQPVRIGVFHDGSFSPEEGLASLAGGAATGGVVRGGRALYRVGTRVPLGEGGTNIDATVQGWRARKDLPMGPPRWDPTGGMRPKAFREKYWDPALGSDGGWRYPEQLTYAEPGTIRPRTLQPGQFIDRFGKASGRWLSPEGTPLPARSLPPNAIFPDEDGSWIYFRYEVLKPFDVEMSEVAPAFGQPGGGFQYRTDETVQDLIERGYLRRAEQ